MIWGWLTAAGTALLAGWCGYRWAKAGARADKAEAEREHFRRLADDEHAKRVKEHGQWQKDAEDYEARLADAHDALAKAVADPDVRARMWLGLRQRAAARASSRGGSAVPDASAPGTARARVDPPGE